MDVAIIGDERQDSELFQMFKLLLGRNLTAEQEKKLNQEVRFSDRVCPPVSYLIHDLQYEEYLNVVKDWANKNKWSTATIVNLLVDPARAKTGWFAYGGKPLSEYEWEEIKKWTTLN